MKIFDYIYKYKYKIFIIFILSLLICLLEILFPLLLKNIINFGLVKDNFLIIKKLSLILLFDIFLFIFLKILFLYFVSKISNLIVYDIRSEVFKKVCNLKMFDFNKFGTSSLINRTIIDEQVLLFFLQLFFNIVFIYINMFFLNIFIMFNINFNLTLLLVLCLPFLILGFYFIFIFTIPFSEKLQKNIDKINLKSKETVSGIKYIKVFLNKDFQNSSFDELNLNYQKLYMKLSIFFSLSGPTFSLLISIVTAYIIRVTFIMCYEDEFALGNIILFLSLLFNVLFSILMISIVFTVYPKYIASKERISDLLSINNKKEKKTLIIKKINSIEFKNVCFKYNNKYILNNINFYIQKGQNLIINGENSSGKSTIIKLLLKIYDNYTGLILINNIPIQKIDTFSIRKLISYTPQSKGIFYGTIRYNLDFKNKYNDKEIYNILDKVDLLNFVLTKKEKLNFILKEEGKNLSGGQIKRILLARSLLKKSFVNIYDESFSALDSLTAIKIKKNILKIKNKEINIFINECDRSIFIEKESKIIFI